MFIYFYFFSSTILVNLVVAGFYENLLKTKKTQTSNKNIEENIQNPKKEARESPKKSINIYKLEQKVRLFKINIIFIFFQ